MKIISESWFKRHRWTLLVFLFLVFRPHITAAIRNHVVIPFKKHILHDHRTMPSKKLLKPKAELSVHYAGIVLLNDTGDTEDDGCSDEDGDACSTESEYYETENDTEDDGCSDEEDDSCESSDEESDDSDYSEDDGCSDDEGCESDDEDTYSSDDSDYYEDDGCSCQGETVVYSDDTPENYYNSTLRVHFSVYTGGADWTIRIEDTYGKTLYTMMRIDNVASGNYSYSWSGDYYDGAIGQSRFILPGSYYVVLQRRDGSIYQSKKSFTYNSKNGFQVDGLNINEINFMY